MYDRIGHTLAMSTPRIYTLRAGRDARVYLDCGPLSGHCNAQGRDWVGTLNPSDYPQLQPAIARVATTGIQDTVTIGAPVVVTAQRRDDLAAVALRHDRLMAEMDRADSDY